MNRVWIASLQDGSQFSNGQETWTRPQGHEKASKKDHSELSDLCWAEMYSEEHIAFIPKVANPLPQLSTAEACRKHLDSSLKPMMEGGRQNQSDL